ncbi:serine hydrolase domain-containing protein [Maricaulis parjimensis]|uniref:serine hydrolase domain-containing protein n=1 Tax=Maricaulis parjimensis TaxID=144023 RepID=UPI00193A22B4|nr:serine hydrolase domain-containing protein [Maricaulis parjimensis]
MRILIALLTSLTLAPAWAQTPSPALPILQEAIDEAVESGQTPGLSVTARLPDGQRLQVFAGNARDHGPVPIDAQTRFLSGSTGKTIAALLAVQLVEDGVLSLDEALETRLAGQAWWDRLRNHDVLTLRMLLNHSAGVPDYLEDVGFYLTKSVRGTAWMEPEDLVGFVAGGTPNGIPGEHYAYSDTDYILVGLVIEAVTGEAFYELARTRIIEPLNLISTEPLRGRDFEGLADGHVNGWFGLSATARNGRLNQTLNHEWTGGGWVTTPDDLVTLYHALGDDGLFAQEGRLMRTNFNAFQPDGPSGYGLGVFVRRTGEDSYRIAHGGDFGGYRSAVLHDSASGITLAVQANSKAFEAPDFNFELLALLNEPE